MVLTNLINEIEAEISQQYLPNAIYWADMTYDNAWSKAIDRFDKALSLAAQNFDHVMLEREANIYKQKVISLLKEFKRTQRIVEADSFLETIKPIREAV